MRTFNFMYKPQELATKLGLSVRTLQRWDKTGKLPAKRTVTNYRYYTEDDLRIAQGLKPLEAVRKTVIYCRVSSNAQKPELKNQVAAMQTFCLGRGMVIDETITEIGGGLNFKRKKFMALIISALKGEVKTIVIAHKDRPKQITVKTVDIVGVDLGIKLLSTLSTGVVFPNTSCYKKSLGKLQRLSKQLSRKQLGSNRRNKAKLKLARHHAKVANTRKNNLHKITTYLCKSHAKVVIEDLNVSGMMANHKLAQSITDCGFHEFKRQLVYKAYKFGSEIILANRWYPSTKTCSSCGHVQDMPLSERVYNCGGCSHSIDRDLNAAINLSRLAKA